MTVESKQESAPASIKAIWEKTIVRFQERTGQMLDGVSRGPADLQKLLDAHYAAQADDKNVSKAKEVGFQMIHCIQLLGGIAAQGASMVFAPAGLCFNALSFLLDIPKKVHEFHGEIDAIFAEVGPALANFRIYERMEETSQIDEALRMSIYQIMTSFVNLCADCINIHHEGRWKSFKRSAKGILLDDGSVQSELAHFKKLTQDQLNLQATLTLEVAVETGQHVRFLKDATLEIHTNTNAIKSDVSGLVEAEHRRTLIEDRQHILSTITIQLGLGDNKITAVLEARDTMWKSAVKESGKWLNEIDAYKQWMDNSSGVNSLLVLTGERGTGKSFLVSAIAREIKSANVATRAERNLVGYYSFSLVEQRDREGNRQRLEAAIKSICVQLAEQDLVYARRVSGVCSEPGKNEKYFRDASCMDLWNILGIGMPTKKMTHYILLDSVSTLSAEDRERLWRVFQQSNQGRSNRVRIFVSGEPGAFYGMQGLSSPAKTIEITKYNELDIKAFIVEELKSAGIFQGVDKDSQRRKKMVEERLFVRSNHNYSIIQQDLRQVEEVIASGGTEEELNRLLHESSTDPRVLVRSDIEALEATLKPREIEEINELLMWTVAGDESMSLEELAAALYYRFNTVPLQPLEDKSMFGTVVARRDRPRRSEDDPKITATISITNGDLRLVQRFFWDLNHYSFLGGFKFQPASDQTTQAQRKVQVYKADAHLEIVKRAFNFFLQPVVDENARELGSYLMSSIPLHLRALSEVTGMDELLPADKQFIGSKVYQIFTDGDLIERNWEFCQDAFWYGRNDRIDIFWWWLDDPVAIAGLGPRDKRWLEDLKEGGHRNSELLTPIMTMIAQNWLRKTEFEVYRAYRWISGFLTLSAKAEQDDQAGVNNEAKELDKGVERIIINDNDSRWERIAKAEQWCKQALKVTEPDSTWFIRLGDTYATLLDHAGASENSKKAASILQDQDLLNKEQLRDVLKALAEWATDSESALEYLTEASKLDEDNVEILHAMLQQYVASEKQDEARSIIQKFSTEKVAGTESTLLMALLTTAVSKRDQRYMLSIFNTVFPLLSSHPELWADFQHETEVAIETARTEGKNDELAILLLLQGSARYYLRPDSHGHLVNAAGCLRECLDTIREKGAPDDQDRLDFIKQNAIIRLSMCYLEIAMQVGGEEVEEIVEKLRQIHEDDSAAKVPRSVLASLYTFVGQRDKARDIFRGEMIEAFNILVDDDILNDVDGFAILRQLLNHAGDHENALRAALLLPELQFNDVILEELLAGEEPDLQAASAELVQFYQRECSDKDMYWKNLTMVWREAERLASEAEVGSEVAAYYHTIGTIFAKQEARVFWGLSCSNCGRYWNYDNALHCCKYCNDVDLCDACWKDLRSGELDEAFVCSSTHDWYDVPPLTREQYLHASKGLVLVKTEDWGEELVSVSKWLGTLCEEWGLSKADWNFE